MTTKRAYYYLNDHWGSKERFRIESTKAGQRTIWGPTPHLKQMQRTKTYIESVWDK